MCEGLHRGQLHRQPHAYVCVCVCACVCVKDYIGGNCTVSLMLMGLGGLFEKVCACVHVCLCVCDVGVVWVCMWLCVCVHRYI